MCYHIILNRTRQARQTVSKRDRQTRHERSREVTSYCMASWYSTEHYTWRFLAKRSELRLVFPGFEAPSQDARWLTFHHFLEG